MPGLFRSSAVFTVVFTVVFLHLLSQSAVFN